MSAERRPSAVITASIHADKKSGLAGHSKLAAVSDFIPMTIKYLIAACGCIGSAMTFLTCVDTDINKFYAVAAIAFLCLVFTFAFSLKERWYRAAGAFIAVITILWVYSARYEICAGLAGTMNSLLYTVREKYRSEPFIYIIEPEASEVHANIFAFWAEYMMCIFCCHSAVRGNSASGVIVSTCIPFFSVLMFGLEPNGAAFFAVIICWAAMLAMESNAAERIADPRCKKYSSHCGFCTAVISALCVLAVLGGSKLFGYERPEKLNVMYDEAVDYLYGGGVQQVIDDIVTIATRNIGPTGAINHGKLGEFDDISFDGKTVLEVTMPRSDETVYLRGFVGSVYTGRSWEQLPSAKLRELESITSSFNTEGLSPLLMDSYNLKYTRAEMPQYSFSVKNISANTNYLYMPYNLVPESVSRYRIDSGSSFGGSDKYYIGQFYDPKNYYGYQNIFRKKWSTPAALSEDEAVYRNFVYANYLDIPESFSPAEIFDESYYDYITAEWTRTGKSTLDEMTVLSRKIYFIRKWLRDNCEYSLSAGKLPAGRDFVDYFLENREGSCSHFASAAVIMCRYAGIPARYAEGYVIKPADFSSGTVLGNSVTVSVSDLRGHAWAEIYLDGFGWYPVEFTSGYGNIRTAIPTETTVSEPETEPEPSSESEPEPGADADGAENASSEYSEAQGTEYDPESGADASQLTTAAKPAETEVSSVSESIVTDTGEAVRTEENKSSKPTVGFGIFGLKGGEKVDVLYDLTWLVVLAAVIVIVPAALILRRNAARAKRRRTALRSAKAAAIDEYKRFGKILKLMEMPEQGEMSCRDYAETLSERSEMLSDGTAELVIGCALKASFGGNSITEHEVNEMRLAVNSLAKRFCARLSGFGKFKLKFIYCIL